MEPSVEIKPRAKLYHVHIQAAALFARQSYAIESEHGGETLETLRHTGVVEDDQAYVVGAIFTSVAFLEATINELFGDVVDDFETQQFKQLAPDTRKAMVESWEQCVSKHSILDKYQAALAAAEKEEFSRGESICQEVQLLFKLRNALVHYQPEFLQATTGTIPKKTPKSKSRGEALEVGLRGRFDLNPWFLDAGNPHFPYKFLGHGCTEWAVSSSLKFADEFFRRLEVTPPHDVYRSRLETR